MMYLANCVAGLEEVAAKALQNESFRVRITHRESGLLLFTTEADRKLVQRLPYFNNVFLLLGVTSGDTMDGVLASFMKKSDWVPPLTQSLEKAVKSFRLYLSNENRLIAADKKVLGRFLEEVIVKAKLKLAPRRPDIEIWVLRRATGEAYLCRRLTQRDFTEKNLAPGELRPELAHLLCLLSEPKETDVVLDPFTGSGALAFARQQYPYNMLFMSDSDGEKIKAIKEAVKAGKRPKEKKGHPVILRTADATKLDKLEDGFVTTVLADPPWGMFTAMAADDLALLYEASIAELCRVTKPNGHIIWLTGRRELADEMGRKFSRELAIAARHDILVSGKKAVVIKWRRKP